MIDLDELEMLARLATPGPWKVYVTPVSKHGGVGQPGSDESVFEDRHVAVEDSRYIAAVNPQVVLELIEQTQSLLFFVKDYIDRGEVDSELFLDKAVDLMAKLGYNKTNNDG